MLSFVFNVNFVLTEYVNLFCFRWLDIYATLYWRFDVMRIYQSLEIFNWILLLPFCSRLSLPLMMDSWNTTQNKRDHEVFSLKWCGGRRSFVSQGVFLFFFHYVYCSGADSFFIGVVFAGAWKRTWQKLIELHRAQTPSKQVINSRSLFSIWWRPLSLIVVVSVVLLHSK